MVGKKVETAYYVQKDWKLSPEVWGTFVKFGVWCVVGGFILAVWAGCSDVGKDVKHAPCKVPASTAPAQRK